MRHGLKLLFAILWLLASAIPAGVQADPLGDRTSACLKGDARPSTLITRLRQSAEAGDSNAQYCLGFMYFVGQSVEKNYAEAFKWFSVSAKRGDGGSQFYLGIAYAYALGVSRDWVRAYMWLNLAVRNRGETAAGTDRVRDEISGKLLADMQLAEAQAMEQRCLASNYTQCE